MAASFFQRIPTRIKRWLAIFCIAAFSVSVSAQTTLYTYQSGSWDNIDVWTTDPGGTTLIGSKIPGNGDAIVVLPSRTLTLAGNITETGLSLNIQAGGAFDASSFTFISPLASLTGQGTYMLSSASFPTATLNTLTGAGGGTVEYYNTADFSLPAAQTSYFNLNINCPGFTATQLNNITVNGNLKVLSGTYRINDGTAARRTLVVNGDVEVSSGAFLKVGTGNTTTTTNPLLTGEDGSAPFLDYYVAQAHRIELYGNLTNNGTVRFTNQNFPVFNVFPANGFASVYFRGAADKTITCNGTTDFYNLIVDKGTDQTFVLSVNSTAYDRFRIFGANVAKDFTGTDASNPNILKALWIRNGTLRLNGYAFIPSLVEGAGAASGDFIIPGNGALIIGGPEVVVMGTIDDYKVVELAWGVNGLGGTNGVTTGSLVPSGISLYGKLQVNEGKLYIGEYGRIVYYGSSAAAQFIINGGTIDIKEFQSVLGGGKTAYWQTGGTLVLRGRFQRSLLYTNLTNLISSIGNSAQLNNVRVTGPDPGSGTLNIDQPENIFHMEGGSIEIYDVTGTTAPSNAIEINSDPANISVTGGTVNINITTGSVPAEDINYGIQSNAALYNTIITRKSGSRKAILVQPYAAMNNLTLSNTSGTGGTVLDAAGYSLKVGGNFLVQANAEYTPGSNRTVFNGTGAQSFTNQGTITSGLHRFIIEKNSGTLTLGSNVTVRDSLVILGGTLADGGYTLQVAGNIYNGGTHTGSGKIVLNGIGPGIQNLSASLTAVLGNLEINSTTTNAVSAALASDISVKGLVMTSGHIFDIGAYRLSVGSGGIGCTSPGTSKMIRTNGLSSNKGLEIQISLTGSYPNSVVATYPIGVSGKYTPAKVYINGSPGTVSGKLRVVPVNNCHPASDCSKALQYYWKTFVSPELKAAVASTVTLEFTYISKPDGPKALYINKDGNWSDAAGSISGNSLTYNGIGFLTSDFTAGNPSDFNKVDTYFSVKSGAFNDATVWSKVSHTSPGGDGVPTSISRVVIGGRIAGNDSIAVPDGYKVNVASIQIKGSYTNNNRRPVLNIRGTTGHTIDIISGAGKFSTSTSTIPSSDYGEFLNNDTAVFNYFGDSYTLSSSIAEYPNLLITGNGTKTLRSDNTTIRKDLIIADAVSAGNALSLNGTSGNLVIYGNVKFRNGAKLIVPSTNTPRNIDIYGNIDFRYGNTSNVNSIEAATGGPGAVHKINFYGSSIVTGSSNLLFDQDAVNKIELYLKNPGKVSISDGPGNFNLYRLIVQKDVVTDTVYFRHNFTLNPSGNSNPAKSLTLSTGTLVLSDPANGAASTIDLNLTSGGNNYFNLNSNSALILKNGSKINILGNTIGSGIRLDGLLRAEGASEINLADGTGTKTGYIEYSGSGSASLVLSGSSVLRVAQVRRSLTLSTGILNYSQEGTSSATIYGIGTVGIIDPSRAKFEITGTSSVFNMSGTSTLSILSGGGTTYGDLYLRPGTSSVTGGTIIFGTGTAGQVFKVDTSVPLNNLTLNAASAANEILLMVNPLQLRGSLVLTDVNSRFTANNLNVTIGGNFTGNGTYTAGTNTTIFNGATQSVGGAADPLFNNLTLNPSVKVTLSRSITVASNLNITSGTLETGSNDVTLRGNVVNNGTYTNNPAGVNRLYLNGTTLQAISGTGSFGRMELDNATGGARLGNNLSLTEDLTITNGVLDINQYSLTLGPQSDIAPVAFGTGRMIKSDGVYSNGGIIKYFNAGFTGNFVFPSGVSGKYTPATLTINATNAGWVRINVINSRHPATLLPFNVLGCYWEVQSAISGFDGSLTMKYAPADVTGDESLYVAGRLVIPPGTGWSKAAAGPTTDNVNETAHTIFFNLPAGTTNLGGQYTAGYTSDLPNTIPVYTSNTALGDWDSPSSWLPLTPGSFPDGVIVVIRPGDVINTHGNRRFAFKTTINGTLVTGTSYGHNLGTVDGTGTLSLSQANLPAGDFSSFIGCDGGTLEYGGGSYTIIADRIDTVKNIIFRGTGTKTLPDKDLVICNNIEINGPVLDNHFNRKLSIGGSFLLTSGGFLSGSGAEATVTFNGTVPQTLSGFMSANPINNLEIKNSAGLTLNSEIMMKGNLILTNGIINTTTACILRMTGQTSTATSGSANAFVNGPMTKDQLGGIDFTFPIGKAGRNGRLDLISPQSGVWEAEYYNSAYADATVAGTLMKASTTEHWRINSPSDGKTATVKIRWDSQSDISPLTTTGGITDIRVAEYDGADWREKTSAAPSGNDTDGTVQTSGNVPISNAGHPRYYTLGSVSSVKPTINLGIPSPVCRCITAATLPYLSVSGDANQYTIDWNAAANTAGFIDVAAWTGFMASPISLSVPSSAAPGVYTGIIKVRYSVNPGNVSIPYTFSIIILPDVSWTGSAGTDWNNSANWSCPFIPDSTVPVVIPDVVNKPSISSGWTCSVNDLTVNTGTSLTISGTLQIAGDITNNGTITATSGGIELNGTSAQIIPAGLFAGNTIRNLTVNNAAGAVLQGPLGVTGIVKVQTGNLASNGNLTLVSDAAGTALIDGSGNGNVTGNVTMQRYLSSRFGYKYMSSPFQNATVSQFGNEINLAAAFSPIYKYDENRLVGTPPVAASGWVSYKTASNPLIPLSGYSVNFGSLKTSLTVDVTGVVNNGYVETTVYNHDQTYTKGFNLVGNPYPSAIDWDAALGWTKINVDQAVYYFIADATDQYSGIYKTYIPGVSTWPDATGIIPSMQGFFIHVSGPGSPVTGTLAMDNRVRINDQTHGFLKASVSKSVMKSLVRISAGFSDAPSYYDPLVIYMDEKATDNFDSMLDAFKLFNTDTKVPNFYSMTADGTGQLAINALPFPENSSLQPIPLGLRLNKNGEVVFRILNMEGNFSSSRILFYDALTGISQEVYPGSDYKVTLGSGTYSDRFYLLFSNVATEITELLPRLESFRAYHSDGVLKCDLNALSREGIIRVDNLTGQTMMVRKVNENGHYEFDLNVKSGMYIVSFVSATKRISNKIFINE